MCFIRCYSSNGEICNDSLEVINENIKKIFFKQTIIINYISNLLTLCCCAMLLLLHALEVGVISFGGRLLIFEFTSFQRSFKCFISKFIDMHCLGNSTNKDTHSDFY